MNYKILSIITLALLWFNHAAAQIEENVTLEANEKETYTSDLGFSLVEFKLVSAGEYSSKVQITIENLQSGESLMLFYADKTEDQLKKERPKIEFDKTFGGNKGKRRVTGYSDELWGYTTEIAPSRKTKITIHVSNEMTKNLVLPFYIVKTEHARFGGQRIKILREETVKFNITVIAWNEQNERYVAYMNSIDSIKEELRVTKFCSHRQHSPSVEMQQEPYRKKIDEIRGRLDTIRRSWMNDQLPHKAYTQLIEELNSINLDDYRTSDCGMHKESAPSHKCQYCSLPEVEISHQLDDLYKEMLGQKISKENASKRASALYQCYTKNKKRKKTSAHKSKIEDFYNRIVNR